jgi:beta-xylosidase
MLKKIITSFFLFVSFWNGVQAQKAQNPVIFADVPDMSMIRVGDTYYMSSTTMHMVPNVPMMKSKDLVNWQLVSYPIDTLGSIDELNLRNGKSTYGRGSWASSLRFHKGTYYLTTFAQTTNKTYVFTTKNIEKGLGKSTLLLLLIMIIPYFLMMIKFI